jgi:CHAT domain-containing protein/Tfp pilus assembly protein PilF
VSNQIPPVSNPLVQRLPTIRCATLIITMLIWAGLPAAASFRPGSPPAQASNCEERPAQNAQENRSLEPGKPVEQELAGGQSHSYQITMIPGQYLEISVDQRGIDVAVALFTPDGEKRGEVDRVGGFAGSETISVIAEAAGKYRIDVRSFEKAARAGRYEIKIEELKEATAEDRYRVAAGAVFTEAERLGDGTSEARKKSIEKYHEALELYRRSGDRRSEANTLNNIGQIYYLLGETQKALEKLNEALPIRRAIVDRGGTAQTLNNLGVIYRSFGEMQKALECYNEALPIMRALGDRSEEAITLNNLGLAYRSMGEMQRALEKYDEALPIWRDLGDFKGEATTLNNLGSVYWLIGETRKALEYYNEALPIRRKAGDRIGEANTLNNIGSAYVSLGETQKALEKLNEALPINRAIGDRRSEAATLNNIGQIYRSVGEIQKALEKFNEALSLSREVGNRSGEASTLENIGMAYRTLGEMQKALETFNESLQISRAISNRIGEANTLTKIGMVYRSLGEMEKALSYYNEALPISRAVRDRSGEANSLTNIGAVYLSLGDLEQAMKYYNEALPILQTIGERSGEATTLLGIARVEQKLGNLSQARRYIEQAIGIIESLRANIASQELRASYFASQQEFYQSYINVLMQMHKQSPSAAFDATALAVCERARARSLLEMLIEARADIRQGVDSSLLERERSLRQRLSAKTAVQINLLTSKHTPAQLDAATKEISSIAAEYEELKAQIRASSPRYAALTQPQPLSLSEIQQQTLDPETLLLEYSLGDDASYLFVISHTSIKSYLLPKREEIEATTQRVRNLLTASQPRPGETATKRQARIRDARANYWPQAAALSRMLLGPAASQLGAKRLLIVADGALQYLPFGALPTPERLGNGGTRRRSDKATERNNKSSPTPLIVKHEIVHLPSASTLAVLRRELAGRQPAPKAVAVLADPVFSADDARVKLASSDHNVLARNQTPPELTRSLTDVRGTLTRLLMTRDEAQAILSLSSRNDRFEALDFRASHATSTSDELSQYRIVHFATHGLLNSQHPQLSGLILSLVDERGQPQDGFLQLHEIFNLRLPAELVVLSACQTGLGKEIKGEGLVGLTRGFMYAGAARVMASLWQVDDAATAELMKRFYRRMLQERMRPAAALRAAQVEMWKRPQWELPYYWGAFVLQGEWR